MFGKAIITFTEFNAIYLWKVWKVKQYSEKTLFTQKSIQFFWRTFSHIFRGRVKSGKDTTFYSFWLSIYKMQFSSKFISKNHFTTQDSQNISIILN